MKIDPPTELPEDDGPRSVADRLHHGQKNIHSIQEVEREAGRVWFSSMLRRVCLVEGKGLVAEETSVVVFRSDGLHDAKRRIVDISRGREERYVNVDGQRVRWTVREIVTLDCLEEGDDLGDSREVYSKIEHLSQSDASVPFDAAYRLEDAQPRQTGV